MSHVQSSAPATAPRHRGKIDWSDIGNAVMPVWEPATREEREAAKLARLTAKAERERREEAYHETVDAMVIQFSGDPEGLWRSLTANTTGWSERGPLEILSLLRSHPQADVTAMDPMMLMETTVEICDYRYAYYAKCAIGNIIGHQYMRGVAVKGKCYWPRSEYDLF